ncbi:MAG: DUF6163 family protein [Pseudomonadota bacterium]
MTYADELKPAPPSKLEIAEHVYLRLLSIVFLGFAVFAWIRIVGLYDGVEWRFDIMPVHWKIISVIMAVLLPVVSVGLWTLLPWGQVVWSLVVALEVTMHVAFKGYFEQNDRLVIFHLSCVAVFLIFRGISLYRVKKE